MASFLGSPKVQYFESGTAEFLSGGKLYSYQAGTLIASVTYPTIADADAQTNANANPVILDARGEASVVIAGATKLILKDSDDNTIWTEDDIGVSAASGDIVDTAGETLLKFVSIVNAVNYLQITNAATGTAPTLESEGSDLNVGMNITSKGSGNLLLDGGATGTVDIGTTSTGDVNLKRDTVVTGILTASSTFTATGDVTITGDVDVQSDKKIQLDSKDVLIPASASAQGEVRLYEDTDNGANYMGLKAPAAVTASTTLVLPDGDGSANDVIVTDGSSNTSWTTPIRSFISEVVASTSATVVFTGLTTAFTQYRLVMTDVIPSFDTAVFYLRTSANGGSSYDANTSDYISGGLITDLGAGTSITSAYGSTVITLAANAGNAANETLSGEVVIHDPTATSYTKMSHAIFSYSAAGNARQITGGAVRKSAATVDAIQIFFSSGTITSGIFRLYGIV